ncbi:MAG: hypothetical protein R3D45_11505 [Rhizobiaceae bacterium]
MRNKFGGAGIALSCLTLIAVVAGALPAAAKPARCFTTDDGYYACNFTFVEGDGSFQISAPGVTTYRLIMDDTPGFAWGFARFSDRFVPLPGQYVRQSDDPACWSNPETSTKMCAW